jgi:PAS domain S-box-containing protein
MADARQVKFARTTELIDQLLADAMDAILILDLHGRLVRINTQAEKLFGYRQEELLGQKPDLLMPKPGAKRNVNYRSGKVPRTEIRPFFHGMESVVRHRDGTEFPVVINLDLIEVGADNLISGAFQKVQHGRAGGYVHTFVEASDDAIIGSDIDGMS